MSDRIEGGSLLIAPDTDADLIIELKLVWAWFLFRKVCVLYLRLLEMRRSAESASMSWAPRRMESFTIPSQEWAHD